MVDYWVCVIKATAVLIFSGREQTSTSEVRSRYQFFDTCDGFALHGLYHRVDSDGVGFRFLSCFRQSMSSA
jgi:hypothetical protein